MNRRVLLIYSSSETGTFFNLLSTLRGALAVNNSAEIVEQKNLGGNRIVRVIRSIAREVKLIPKLLWCDTVVFHSVVWVQFSSIILSYFLRRRIVLIQWDIYPATIDGKPLSGSSTKLYERLERLLGRISTRIVIPSEDFVAFSKHPGLRIMPLWPSVPLGRVSERGLPAEGQPIRLAFVGQAGLTRGLPQAVARLGRETSACFELHIFSPKPPEEGLSNIAPNLSVVPRGYLRRSELLAALDEMDFGLISLHPGMGQPGFPSKTFDYIAAGLPVIYTGRPLPAFTALLERTGVGFALGEAAVDWPATMQKIRSSMAQAVRAFAAETELDPETLDRVIF
jgi:hypothetical protein